MRHPQRRSKWKPGRWTLNQWRSFWHFEISLCVQFKYIVLFKVFTILFHLFPWFPFYLLGNCDACWIYNFILQWFFLFCFPLFLCKLFFFPIVVGIWRFSLRCYHRVSSICLQCFFFFFLFISLTCPHATIMHIYKNKRAHKHTNS